MAPIVHSVEISRGPDEVFGYVTDSSRFTRMAGSGVQRECRGIRVIGKGSLEPLGEGDRTRFRMELDFEGHGIGKLLVPLVVRRAGP